MNMTTTAKVMKIRDDKESVIVSFTDHDGYFTIPSGDMRQKIENAQKSGLEVSFQYDINLTILKIL